jgi:hypothetical protein
VKTKDREGAEAGLFLESFGKKFAKVNPLGPHVTTRKHITDVHEISYWEVLINSVCVIILVK